jgi:hypothetical protein
MVFGPRVRVAVRLSDILGCEVGGSRGSSVGIVTRLQARPGRDRRCFLENSQAGWGAHLAFCSWLVSELYSSRGKAYGA